MRPLSDRRVGGRLPEAWHCLARHAPDRLERGRSPLRRYPRGFPRRPPPRLPGPCASERRHRRSGGKPGPPAGGAQGRRFAADRPRSRGAPPLRRGRRARHARSGGRLSEACRRVGKGMADRRRHGIPAGARHLAEGTAGRRLEGDRRDSRWSPGGRGLARLGGSRLRHCRRHRVYYHRRPSFRSRLRRDAGLGRRHEPADSLRRRPHEPRLLCHDASGRRQGNDRCRSHRRKRPRRVGGVASQCAARSDRRDDRRWQPDHAPPVSGPRPGRAWRRAVCSHRRFRPRHPRLRPRHRHRSRRHGPHPAADRRPRRRRLRRSDPRRSPLRQGRDHPPRRHRHQCRNRPRQPDEAARLFVSHRPRLRGGPDFVRPARRARRHRAPAHRPRSRSSRVTG